MSGVGRFISKFSAVADVTAADGGVDVTGVAVSGVSLAATGVEVGVGVVSSAVTQHR